MRRKVDVIGSAAEVLLGAFGAVVLDNPDGSMTGPRRRDPTRDLLDDAAAQAKRERRRQKRLRGNARVGI
jgi:hypothetical protein